MNLPDLLRAVCGKKAVLLDLDNTLYEYAVCHAHALKAAHRAYARVEKLSFAAFKKKHDRARGIVHKRLKGQAASHGRAHYFKIMLEDAGYRLSYAGILERVYWNAFFTKMKLYDWVKPFLKFCETFRIRKGIVTNLTTALQLRKLAYLKLDKAFDFVVTSEEAGVEKPHPRIFKLALKKARVKASEALVVGDEVKSDRCRFIKSFLV